MGTLSKTLWHYSFLLSQRLFIARLIALIAVLICTMSFSQSLRAEEDSAVDVQSVKAQVLELNKDLFILEEELLFPASTQLAVYVSLDIGYYFKLDAIKLSVDGQLLTSYLYTARQVDALRRGGIQRLYLGNIKNGDHELVAVLTGFGPNNQDYRRGTTLKFNKDGDAKHLELKIVDSSATQQPEFSIKEW